MPVFPYPPSSSVDSVGTNLELIEQRELTRQFIMADPVLVSLTVRIGTRTASGAVNREGVLVRPTQRFKMIYEGSVGAGAGLIQTGDGTERAFVFTMIGEWDAQVALGDYWSDIYRNRWEVDELIPYNGFEVRATVTCYGGDPHS